MRPLLPGIDLSCYSFSSCFSYYNQIPFGKTVERDRQYIFANRVLCAANKNAIGSEYFAGNDGLSCKQRNCFVISVYVNQQIV